MREVCFYITNIDIQQDFTVSFTRLFYLFQTDDSAQRRLLLYRKLHLVLVKHHRAIDTEYLADMFSVLNTVKTISMMFSTWINFLANKLPKFLFLLDICTNLQYGYYSTCCYMY